MQYKCRDCTLLSTIVGRQVLESNLVIQWSAISAILAFCLYEMVMLDVLVFKLAPDSMRLAAVTRI